ncbi:MAG: L,D-transpeptidase [Acidimicrobiia bacterium]|nr:L,D-transpeptidase [Acidimicrobiia bacterium]MDH5292876.1 L,D-transpeptidase [Acidimicrobiia bacterium]
MPRPLIALVFVVAACTTTSSAPSGGPTTVVAPPSTATVETTIASIATTTTTEPPTTTTTELTVESLGPGESLALRSDSEVEVFEDRSDPEPLTVLEAATLLGTPRVLYVLEGPVDGWARVRLPIRPNGSTGWVYTEDMMRFVVNRAVDVDLGDRTLTVSGPEGILLETTIAIGSPSSPTPTGEFFVTDSVIVTEAGGPWGPRAFGLSAYSDTVTEFNGGNGIIGIHGTNQPSSIGHAQSLGCVRVLNDVALQLGEYVSAGVPVRISD